MKEFFKTVIKKAKAVLIFPVAVFVVAGYGVVCFTRLWLQGYEIDNIFQILFVDYQNNLQKLIKRTMYITPVFYIVVIYFVFGSISAIFNFVSKIF